MSEHFFGLGNGKIPARIRDRADKIASRHGATLANPNLPGEGYRYWFAGPNRGHPFDQAMSEAVLADLDAAGIDLAKVVR
jgi:hypothetical protein